MANPRGVFEKVKGSDFWWINYYVNGRRRREPVGLKSAAISLYQKRKTQALQDDKLPELGRKRITVGELLDDALAYRTGKKHYRSYAVKAELVRADLGSQLAAKLTPAAIEAWIDARDVTNATFNRYRAFFSLCYRRGILAGKVRENVARLVPHRREKHGRLRFLDRAEEYPKLLEALRQHQPERVDAFVFSVFTGARLSEQFNLRWHHVDLDRREITFTDTKHGDDRHIPINSVVFEVLERLAKGRPPSRSLVFGTLQDFCRATDKRWKKGAKGTLSPVWFRKLASDAKIHNYTWHSNRHTFCSWHAIEGTPIRTIQDLAGHKSITITMRHAHLSPDHRRSESERIVGPAAPQGPKVVRITTATKTATAATARPRRPRGNAANAG